MRYKVTQGPI